MTHGEFDRHDDRIWAFGTHWDADPW